MKKKILIAIISNRSAWSKHFSMSLVNLIHETRMKHNIEWINVSSCDVNYMRNRACLIAQAKGNEAREWNYDYIVMLDDDHIYPEDFINKFVDYDLPVVTGCTSQRTPPYKQTQYKQIKGIGMKDEENIVNPKETEGLVQIDASGPVGMCIKTEVLEKMKYPYFEQINLNNSPSIRGGDIQFCQQLKELEILLYLDSSVSFPHCAGDTLYADRGQVHYHP